MLIVTAWRKQPENPIATSSLSTAFAGVMTVRPNLCCLNPDSLTPIPGSIQRRKSRWFAICAAGILMTGWLSSVVNYVGEAIRIHLPRYTTACTGWSYLPNSCPIPNGNLSPTNEQYDREIKSRLSLKSSLRPVLPNWPGIRGWSCSNVPRWMNTPASLCCVVSRTAHLFLRAISGSASETLPFPYSRNANWQWTRIYGTVYQTVKAADNVIWRTITTVWHCVS